VDDYARQFTKHVRHDMDTLYKWVNTRSIG